ncbi:hypothetical protein BH10PSE12_BH10PSE12_17050 [soil metagenome]
MTKHSASGYEPYKLLLRRAMPRVQERHVTFVLDTFVGMVMHHAATLHMSLGDGQLELLTDAAIFLLAGAAGGVTNPP